MNESASVINGWNELPELWRGHEIAEIINDGGGLSLNKEDGLSITVDLNFTVDAEPRSAGHWVARDECLTKGSLKKGWIEEVGYSGTRPVEEKSTLGE